MRGANRVVYMSNNDEQIISKLSSIQINDISTERSTCLDSPIPTAPNQSLNKITPKSAFTSNDSFDQLVQDAETINSIDISEIKSS
jgi:hypothetical protein